MLEKIEVKQVATYDAVGVLIDGLRKVNFIYGANGSGKTTISKLLANPTAPNFINCSLTWRGNFPIKCLVYNKDFREANFGKGSLDGVFTLGQATKEEIEAIRVMQSELTELIEKGTKKKKSLESLEQQKREIEDDFKETAWFEIYKKHEVRFKEAFSGVMKKESFKDRIVKEYYEKEEVAKSLKELTEMASTVFGDKPIALGVIPAISYSRLVEIELDGIWGKKIIGKEDIEIAKLIQRLNLNDWVNEGRAYLQENEVCPFCQQKTISAVFKRQIEDYFDESFSRDVVMVKECSNEYINLANTLVSHLNSIESAEKRNQGSKLKLELFSAFLKTLDATITSNKELLNYKTKEPSRGFGLHPLKALLDNIQKLIDSANVEILEHNRIVANYSVERERLIKSVWVFLVEENEIRISAYLKKVGGFQKGIDALFKQLNDLRIEHRRLDGKIKEANKNVTSVQPSVDAINSSLEGYGFTNFKIVPSKAELNRYQIKREDGSVAESTLSEGEVTFVTFLYFLQLARGGTHQEAVSEQRILVVDDPISSLDSSVLFVISSSVKEIVKEIKNGMGNIKQLILLTHNVYFHKEVSFIDGRTKENGDTAFWILRRREGVSCIQSFGLKNPIHSSYELLWQELKLEDKSGIVIQNVMRRIVENYFRLLGRFGDDEIIMKFPTASEQEICRSLICWINDGSHGMPDDLYVEQQEASIEKYFQVFKGVFEHMGHLEHYKMMMREGA